MNDDIIKLVQYNSIYLIEILADELDLVKTPKISRRIEEVMKELDYPTIMVILDKLSYIDSTGISFLVMMGRKIAGKGSKMTLVCRRESILQVFDAVQIDTFVKVFPTVDASEKYLLQED